MNTIGYRTAAGAVLLSLCAAASGREVPPGAHKLTFDINATSMVQALMQFTEQSGLQLAFPVDGSTDMPARRVVGDYTPAAALDQLLQGSGLHYEFANERTVSISPDQGSGTAPDRAAASRMHLAQADGEPARLAAAPLGSTRSGMRSPAERDTGPEKRAIPEVLVRGGRTLNMDIQRTRDDAQPYVVFDRAAIEQSGSHNVQEFLRSRLSAASTFASPAQSAGSGSAASSIDLRGLGPSQTLILVDGRRAAPRNGAGSSLQPDLNGIPLSAIERIEVLPATASGIYGGGATGGVVNIVLRRDYSGLDTTMTYGNSFDGGGATRRVDFAGGLSLEEGRTSVTVAGSYASDTDLLWSDRDFVERARALVLANNPNALLGANPPPLGATTNIRSSSGAPLTLKARYGGGSLNSAITHVPYGYQGPASDGAAALRANAGSYNLDPAPTAQSPGSDGQSLLSKPTVRSLSASARRSFLPWMEAFVDLSAFQNSGSAVTSALSGQFTLQPTAANNPFNEAIIVRTPTVGADLTSGSSESNYRAVAGFIFDLPKDWRAETDYTWSRSRTETTFADATLTPAAGTAVSSGATASGDPFDVFQDTSASALSFEPYLTASLVRSPLRLTFRNAAVRLAGPLGWSLPAGAPTVTTLLEHRKDALDDVVSVGVSTTQTAFARSQSAESIYVETLIPLVAPHNDVPAVNLLELQLAARRDEYSITGANSSTASNNSPTPPAPQRVTRKLSSTDPTFSLRYQPIASVTVRGSYGTGFLPPGMSQLVPNPPTPGVPLPFTDPRRGNQPIAGGYTVLSGGNPDLRPEESKSWSAGLVFHPAFAPGLRTSLDWVSIEKRDNIQILPLTQASINNELAMPGFITRGPASGGFDVGPITRFNLVPLNIARQDVEAVDAAADYRLETAGLGAFTLSLAGTRNLHNLTQVTAASPELEGLGLAATPKWKGNLALAWDRAEWSVQWTARYIDSYCLLSGCATGPVTLSQGSASVPSQTYHDLVMRYRFPSAYNAALLENVDVRLGMSNIFNKTPPVDLGVTALYSTYGDPRKGSYFLSVTKRFGE